MEESTLNNSALKELMIIPILDEYIKFYMSQIVLIVFIRLDTYIVISCVRICSTQKCLLNTVVTSSNP